mgnify:CR=1 FL=1
MGGPERHRKEGVEHDTHRDPHMRPPPSEVLRTVSDDALHAAGAVCDYSLGQSCDA